MQFKVPGLQTFHLDLEPAVAVRAMASYRNNKYRFKNLDAFNAEAT